MSSALRTEGEPHDRLTRISDAASRAIDAHPENGPDIKAIIMVDDDERGGMVFHGYEEDADAIVAIFGHLQAALETRGQTLLITGINEG